MAIFCHTSPSTSLKSFFNVALFRTPEVTIPQISDHQVPILINSYVDLSKLPGDVSLPHLVMHIDGVSHIKKLAREVDMDINYVKKSLLLLQHHKVVILSDLFKFSNIYKMVSDQSIEMLAVPEVEQEMMMFVVNATYLPYYMNEPTSAATPIPHPMNHPTSPSEIPSYALLCSAIISLITDLHPAHTVAQIVIKQKQKFVDNIFKYYDLVRLLAYLQYKEIVTRVNEYPVYMGQNLNPSVTDTQSLLNLNDDLASHRYPPSGMLTHEALESSHRFQRLTRKTTNKSIFSGQTLNLHHGHHGHHHGSSLPTLSPEVVLNQVIRYLDGSECLDYICCKFEINHLDIINHPQVSIIYK